jgi:hypothetical protein
MFLVYKEFSTIKQFTFNSTYLIKFLYKLSQLIKNLKQQFVLFIKFIYNC